MKTRKRKSKKDPVILDPPGLDTWETEGGYVLNPYTPEMPGHRIVEDTPGPHTPDYQREWERKRMRRLHEQLAGLHPCNRQPSWQPIVFMLGITVMVVIFLWGMGLFR